VELGFGRSPKVNLEVKHFFSGAAVYVNGKICMSFTPAGLALKLPENQRIKLIRDKKAKLLQYFPKGPIKKDYAVLTEPLIEDLEILSYWMNLCIDYVTKTPHITKEG
jgi:hypothetical protein